jgi:hypothetical protein
LIEVPDARVLAVVRLRVHAVHPLHPLGKRVARRLDDQMEVVVEHAVRVKQPSEPVLGVDDASNELVAVVVVGDDPLACDAAHGYVDDAIRGEDRGAG